MLLRLNEVHFRRKLTQNEPLILVRYFGSLGISRDSRAYSLRAITSRYCSIVLFIVSLLYLNRISSYSYIRYGKYSIMKK